jgi:hypothetical protein
MSTYTCCRPGAGSSLQAPSRRSDPCQSSGCRRACPRRGRSSCERSRRGHELRRFAADVWCEPNSGRAKARLSKAELSQIRKLRQCSDALVDSAGVRSGGRRHFAAVLVAVALNDQRRKATSRSCAGKICSRGSPAPPPARTAVRSIARAIMDRQRGMVRTHPPR